MTGDRERVVPTASGERGVAMAVVLFTITIIVIVSATLVALAMNEYQIAGSGQASRQAIQLTEGAVEVGIYHLKLDADWADTVGATKNVTADGQWYPLFDGAPVSDRNFPAANPLGQITVELCRASSAGCPGAINSASVLGCTPASCIWIQATGKVGRSSRRIHVLLGQPFPGPDVPNFSNTSINIGAGGGGNGTFSIHGSLYIAGCTDPDGNGPQPCIGLRMQGNAAIQNDTPYPVPGDDPDLPPYNNRVHVAGWITGQGNSFLIGSSAQPMRGIHAHGWAARVDDQLFGLEKDRNVPRIPFPDPSKPCVGSDPTACLITRIYHPTDPLPISNAMVAYVCTNPGGCTATQWREVNLTATDDVVPFCAQSCSNPWGGGNIRTKVVIPDRLPGGAPAVNCRLDAPSATACNTGGVNSISGANNFSLVFNGFGPLAGAPAGSVLNLAIQRSTGTEDTFLHTRQPLRFRGDIYYNTVATIIVENASLWSAARPPVHINRASLTPECRASQRGACTQTFGQPREISGNPFGNTLAFAVGPACSTNPLQVSSCTPPPGGGIYIEGSKSEINLVLLAHGTIKNDNPQSWYGLFIANLLDWDNSPQIFMVPGLKANLPPGIADLTGAGSGVAIFRWREVF